MSSNISKRYCCTCLCEDRKLFSLCRVPDGVNLLYMLLLCDSEAYREGFFKDTASWMVCWECSAVVKKIMQFRAQTCTALKQLKDLADGKINENELQCLSSLSTFHSTSNIQTNMFVDCYTDKLKNETINIEPYISDVKRKVKKTKYFIVNVMDDTELIQEMDRQRMELKDVYRCDYCVLGFKDEVGLKSHMELHTKKENHTPCHICRSYIPDDALHTHTNTHNSKYVCVLCKHTEYARKNIFIHLREMHGKSVGKKKLLKKTKRLKSKEPVKYPCTECDMIFENKGAKWKHIQKCHRDGHQCDVCQKVFTFKHNLQRHQLSHTNAHPRTECPTCHKQVRSTLLITHLRTHAPRSPRVCAPCGKNFVCSETYERHLKYASVHAGEHLLRHACTTCEKRFRSRGELRDHIAYRHDAKPTHKCPVCDKMLATQRCVTRHVRRTHEGVRERARDKMCHYCGLAFRDKQSLSEHISRHTGARPLACTRCGRAFRQRAALHVHTARAHKHD